ncbi:MAG: cytochrome c3 family protein, partial [Deltaproteobacteria bacterium]|nr:cytochrome c3 family protein [Deltaproteobacteria bacterium]
MKRLACQLLLVSAGLALALGCGGDPPLPAPTPPAKAPLPYQRVAVGGTDRADNGPGDSTVMDAIKGTMGSVKFRHFTHSSNTEKGYGIPCAQCHHKTDAAKDPEEGCAGADCHAVPGEGADPAHGGAEDNLFLRRIQTEAAPVAFNHFTHASSDGYKLACSSCHHTGDLVSCTTCHKELPTKGEKGVVIVKVKRAFHKICQDCHQSLRQTKPDSPAPVACKDCHQDRIFETPVEGLTLNRALHLSCTHCHEL